MIKKFTRIKNIFFVFIILSLSVYLINSFSKSIYFPYYNSLTKSIFITILLTLFLYFTLSKVNLDFKIKHQKIWLSLIVLFFTVLYGYLNNKLHTAFNTSAFDMNLYDNVYWNMFRGKGTYFFSSVMQQSLLGHHQSYITLINGLLYKILPISIEWTFYIRTFFLSLGGLILYNICRFYKLPVFSSLMMFLIYCIYPATAYYSLDIFHPEDYIIIFMLLGHLLLLKKHKILPFLCFLLVLISKDDAAFIIIIYSIIIGFKFDRRFGISLLIISLVYFFTNFFYLSSKLANPDYIPMWKTRYTEFDSSIIKIIILPFSRPFVFLKKIYTMENINYIGVLFIPLLFLPLKKPLYLLCFLPTLYLNLLADYFPQKQIMGCYQYTFLSVIWLSAVLSLKEYDAKKQPRILITIMSACIMMSYCIGPFPWARTYKLTKKNPYKIEIKYKGLKDFIEKVPLNSTVCSVERVLPHFTHNTAAYWFGFKYRYPVSFSYVDYGKPDYYLLDLKSEDIKHYKYKYKQLYLDDMNEIINSSEYTEIMKNNNWILLKHK